jgi:hypothetical protein
MVDWIPFPAASYKTSFPAYRCPAETLMIAHRRLGVIGRSEAEIAAGPLKLNLRKYLKLRGFSHLGGKADLHT